MKILDDGYVTVATKKNLSAKRESTRPTSRPHSQKSRIMDLDIQNI
jgi:hypothetical protein